MSSLDGYQCSFAPISSQPFSFINGLEDLLGFNFGIDKQQVRYWLSIWGPKMIIELLQRVTLKT
jgi:hypothetical protein